MKILPMGNIMLVRLQKNIRILFAFIEYNKVKYALLLCVFEEKGQYSYSTGIPVAQKRLKEVLDND